MSFAGYFFVARACFDSEKGSTQTHNFILISKIYGLSKAIIQFSEGNFPVKTISFFILTKWIEKYFLNQSEGNKFANSTIGQKRALNPLFVNAK